LVIAVAEFNTLRALIQQSSHPAAIDRVVGGAFAQELQTELDANGFHILAQAQAR
jgi:hypothetical protein